MEIVKKTTVMLGVAAAAFSLSGLVGMNAASYDWAGVTDDCYDWAGLKASSYDWAGAQANSYDWAGADPTSIALGDA